MPRARSHAARFAALAAAALVLAAPTRSADSETGSPPPTEPALPERRSDVEQLVLETEDGLKLGATFYLPDRKHGRAPAVLIAHGPDGDRAQVATLAEELRKKGFAVLAADLRGHGQSAAGMAWSELDRAERERMWTFALRDLGAAAAFLRGRRDIHTTNLTLVGVGGACALALRHAAGDENARAVVLLAPSEDQLGFSLPDEMQRCGGLPTLVVASRDGRAMAKRFVDGMQSTGVSGLELAVLRSGDADYLSDTKMPDRVAAFLRQVVVERKGR